MNLIVEYTATVLNCKLNFTEDLTRVLRAMQEANKPSFKPGGDSAYERGGDARRKFWIKSLKETDLGVAQAVFDP